MVAVGERVFGKYEVLRRLAVGGMGEIFLARQTGVIDRLVILKNLLPQLADDAGAVAAFMDEARIVGSINHPNVVALYDVGEWDGAHFHAMEYVNGVDLSHLLRFCEDRSTRIPPGVSAQIVREAALGLDAAHVATDATGAPLRIVHRDISPHNLMVRADGLCKVVDFGVAVAENRSQKTEGVGLLKGKLGYMAPEQIKGAPVEPKADQFSLGVLLWEMLAQRRLFTGENAPAIFTRIIKETIPPPSSIKDDVTPELDAIVLRMTAQEPVQRFARLGDAAVALRKALDASRVPDNAAAQFIRATVGAELAARVKDLAAPAPPKATLQPTPAATAQAARQNTPSSTARPVPQGTPSSTARPAFCGHCGEPSQPGDRFCRACGTSNAPPPGDAASSAAGSLTAATQVARRGTPAPFVRAEEPAATFDDVDDIASGFDAELPTTPASPASRLRRTPAASVGPGTVDGPRVDVLLPPVRTRTGAFRLDAPAAARTPSSTRIPETTTTTIAVVGGVVEQLRAGVVGVADGDARRATWDVLGAYARAAGGVLEHGEGPGFSLTFVGENAAATAVAVARGSVRLGARIGGDVLLRLGVAADGGASSEQAARLRAIATGLADHASAGAAVIAEAARALCGDVATSRTATVMLHDGTPLLAHEVALPRRLAGRSAELAALDGLLDDVARTGRALQVLLQGDAGVGKSSVVDTAVSFARDRGFVVGVARGARFAVGPGFDVVRQLLQSACLDVLARERQTGPWSRALELLGVAPPIVARLRALVDDDGDGALDGVPTARRRPLLRASVCAAFERLAERAPLLLSVDDVERADAASLGLLDEVAARLADRRVAVLVSGRTGACDRMLPLARRITLAPLQPADAIAVASLLLGVPATGALAQLIADRAVGYPLVVVVLVRWLLANGLIVVGPDGVVEQVDLLRAPVPENAAHLLHALHAGLPDDVRAVLAAAAALGRIVEVAQVSRLVDRVHDVGGALRILTDAGVLDAMGDGCWAFRSAVEFEAAAGVLDAARAAALRVRVVQLLAADLAGRFRSDTAERLVAHLTAVDAHDRAAELSERVADRADALGMFEVAAEHRRRALVFFGRRLVDGTPVAEAAPRVVRLAARTTASQVEVDAALALEIIPPVLSHVPPSVARGDRIEAMRQHGLALARATRHADAVAVLEAALADAPDDVTALELLVDLAGICEQRGNDVDAIARVEDALRRHAAARAANPAVPVERALEAAVQYARLQLRMGQADGAREIVRQTLDGIQAARSPTLEVEALTIVAAAAQTSGDIVGAVRECERALVVAGQTGDPMVEARVLLQHGRALIAAGRRELATSGLQRALVAARAGCWDEGVAAVQLLLSSTAR